METTYTWAGAPTAAGWICRRSSSRYLSSRFGTCGCGDEVERVKRAESSIFLEVDGGDSDSDAKAHETRKIEEVRRRIVEKFEDEGILDPNISIQPRFVIGSAEETLSRGQQRNDGIFCVSLGRLSKMKAVPACCGRSLDFWYTVQAVKL